MQTSACKHDDKGLVKYDPVVNTVDTILTSMCHSLQSCWHCLLVWAISLGAQWCRFQAHAMIWATTSCVFDGQETEGVFVSTTVALCLSPPLMTTGGVTIPTGCAQCWWYQISGKCRILLV